MNVTAGRATFDSGFDDARAGVFAAHSELVDHRDELPWLTGALGDPTADVWLVAENPSLTQVRKARDATVEHQWSVSPGDLILRNALVAAGLKTGGPLEPGGWRCWITDVIKSADIVKDWRATPEADQLRVAEAWSPVLRYELEHGQPKVLVVLGDKASKLLTHLERYGHLPRLPRREQIYHYSYLGSHPDSTGRGPGHPDRISVWEADLERAAALRE